MAYSAYIVQVVALFERGCLRREFGATVVQIHGTRGGFLL